MPIIEPAVPHRLLSQGDILQDIALFTTKEPWDDFGGVCSKTAHRLCLIISRPCVVGHKPHVIVAAIEKMADRIPNDVITFDDIVSFLTDLRDGLGAPDVFYLGQVPGFEGRFAARLDSLHTIQIPDQANQRAFTDKSRIGHLHEEFYRDLHTRLFRAVATLGFDDNQWMSTQDLRWLLARGRQEISEAEAALEFANTELRKAEAQGICHQNERKKLESAQAKAQTNFDRLMQKVDPFRRAMETREQREPTRD